MTSPAVGGGRALEAMLGYQIHFTNLIAMREIRRTLADLGSTPVKVTALLLVHAHEGCDQTSLGKLLSVNRSAAMKLVNALSDRDLIERRSGRDLRSHSLWLTPAGHAFLEQALAALQASEDLLCRSLSTRERADLLWLLGKVRDSADTRTRRTV